MIACAVPAAGKQVRNWSSTVDIATAGKQVKPATIFVFGDSYADTGNRNKTDPASSQSWQYPYGITWGSGRFSDGRVSTDFYAELFGLPPPKTYASITSRSLPEELRNGINFATGGAGVFPVSGNFPTIFQQVDQLQALLKKYPFLFSPEKAVAIIACSGNDYSQFLSENPSATLDDLLPLADKIVQALGEIVENLYKAGLRNFALGNVPLGGCLPITTGQNATQCDTTLKPLSEHHNAQLSAVIANLQRCLPETRFVELDIYKAFNYVIENHHLFGIKHPLGACCAPLPSSPSSNCGDYDAQGHPLFTVRPNRRDYFFWDAVHPTNAGWEAVVNLFYSGLNITGLSPNLLVWLNSLNLASSDKDPETYEQAAQDLVQSLVPDYPRLLPLLSNAGALPYLPIAFSKVGPVTLFLPSEEAVEQQLGLAFVHKWPALASEVALVQVVYGWWPVERLWKLRDGHSLRTLGGSKLQVVREYGEMFLTAGDGSGRVAVVEASFFADKGAVLVHKTNALILPPSLNLSPANLLGTPVEETKSLYLHMSHLS